MMCDARRAAVAALMKQEQDGYANLVLAAALDRFEGPARDRAFLSALFYGTVERMGTIDWLLKKFCSRPLDRLDAAVRAILRAGVYQARWMDGVPVRAAVSESVALCRKMGKTSAAGLVNAILRRAAEYDLSQEVFPDEVSRLCVQYSVSRPIAELLMEKLPQQCEALLAASFQRPRGCVRVNALRTDPQALAERFSALGAKTEAGPLPGSLFVSYPGDLTATDLFAAGLFHVQGLASQLACAALAPRPGETVLDLCAAPGGKSATLAQYMKDEGRLGSFDAAANRVPLIERQFARLGVTCGTAQAGDASVFDERLAGADAVLCDVPCSGLGTLAKKPDVRYKTLEGLGELEALQRAILDNGARYVKAGGRLVYSTCTLNPDENSGVVTDFLRRHPEFRLREVPRIPQAFYNDDKTVTLYPFCPETDGFFIASMERVW